MRLLIRRFCFFAWLGLCLAEGLLGADRGFTELVVPAHTAYTHPEVEGSVHVGEREGISGWSGTNSQVRWFGRIATPGVLNCGIRLKLPAGTASDLRLIVAGRKLQAHAVGGADGVSEVSFGAVSIERVGYVMFALESANPDGAPNGNILALLLSGPATEGAHFNLKPRRNAASVHLAYPIPKETQVQAFYCEMTGIDDPLWTYYMACGWHRGYFGMQVNSPTERRIIFSVWDSGNEGVDRNKVASENRVTLESKGPGVVSGDFGNEGTGGHSHWVYDWKTGETQRFLVTARPTDASHTVYSGYYFHPAKREWMLISSWRAPKEGGYMRGLYSFSENFGGANGHLRRKALYGNQWIRTSEGRWVEVTTSSFSHDPTGKEDRLDRFMGLENGRFFLSHGGFSDGQTRFGERFERPSTGQPPTDIPAALLEMPRASNTPDESFEKVVLAQGLDEPIQLCIASSGDVVFAERRGGVKRWNSADRSVTLLGRLDVFSGSEDGLLGLALDPGYATNHWLYVFRSHPGILENQVCRFTVVGDHLSLDSEKVLLRIPTLAKKPNHSGGGLGFDAQGNLYASTGDYTFIQDSEGFSPLDQRPGREVHDSERTAANSNDLRGKILRVHPEPDGTYTIPAGNLFAPGTDKTRPEIYIMGCRNPFRFTVDGPTGWLIWGDVGPDAVQPNENRGPAGFDEFNLARGAGNFGWPYFIADNKAYRRYDFQTKLSGEAFDPQAPVNDSPNNTGIRNLPAAQPALIWYPPGPTTRFPELGSGPRSAMAGPIFHFRRELPSETQFPASKDGSLFIWEWERGWINEVRLSPAGRLESIKPFARNLTFKRPISMAFGADGALYVIEWGTAWYNNKDSQLVRIEHRKRT